VFECTKVDRPKVYGRCWTSWEDLDSGTWVDKMLNQEGKEVEVDLVEEFFSTQKPLHGVLALN
jgi:hypothetical protein